MTNSYHFQYDMIRLTMDSNRGITRIDYDLRNTPTLIQFSGGYYTYTAPSKGSTRYHYYITDHLGNSRVVVNGNGDIEQTVHYYPFGGVYADAGFNASFQKYKYNGKELDLTHGLNTYDHGARQNYSILGVWDRVDPLNEKYYSVSPYAYCGDNPVRNVDPDGGRIVSPKGNIAITLDRRGNFHFTSNATTSIKRVAKALLLTPKGKEMLNRAVKSDINVSIILSSNSDIKELSDNKKNYIYGTTVQGNYNPNDNYGRVVDKIT